MLRGSRLILPSYKSINNGTNLENINRINVLIGKNNIGKSSIIELIRDIFAHNEPKVFSTNNQMNNMLLMLYPKYNDYEKTLKIHHPGYSILTKNINGEDIAGTVHLKPTLNKREGEYTTSWAPTYSSANDQSIDHLTTLVANYMRDCLSRYTCFCISADRVIKSEIKNNRGIKISEKETSSDGSGFTNLIRAITHDSRYDEKTLKQKIINAMNRILSPDIQITDIKVKAIDDSDEYEIYIEDVNGGPYPISSLGSGIKTTIQLATTMEIFPEISGKDRSNIVFTLEELENNLHPSAQRRMFQYISDYAENYGSTFFISTHSNTILNMMYGRENVTVYHVEKPRGETIVTNISSDKEVSGILNDMGVCASDVFQSNGVVWVEGPSDRIYIKKWLELAGYTDLIEGLHYQFLYYGGKTLSHYSAEKYDDLINVLKVNRNAALVMDSDRKNESSRISKTKSRVKKELIDNNQFCWITEGKEIENYISEDVFESIGIVTPKIGKYEPFSEFMEKSNMSTDKVPNAQRIVQHMKESDLSVYDLRKNIMELGNRIRKWNENL